MNTSVLIELLEDFIDDHSKQAFWIDKDAAKIILKCLRKDISRFRVVDLDGDCDY